MTSMVLKNATVATLRPRRLERADILIEDERIATIGQDLTGELIVECGGRLVLPGNVCSHTHLYSALARGMPAPPRAPRNFPEILELIWWRLDRALDIEGIRSSVLIGTLDAIRAGTTTLVDHHASPNCIEGSLDVLADAIDEIGARAVVCYEVTDRGGKDRRRAGLRENERFIRDNRRTRIRGMVGAHASFTLEDESLEELAGLALQTATGVHIHVAEDLCDEEDSLQRCGRRTGARLEAFGIFGEKGIAAHGVHLDENELRILENRRTWLVHNCRSNLNNRVGRAPVFALPGRTALGTDGIDGDMFAESRTAYFRAREQTLDAFADQFTDMLAAGGELVSACFGQAIGTFEPGSAADVIVLDYDAPTPLTADNLAWHWMFAFSAANVRSVMVGGRWVLKDGEFCLVDEDRVRAEARLQARRLWEEMERL